MTPGTVLLDTNVFTAWLKPRSTLVPLYGTRLRAECRRVGHPLHQKQHLGDLWIAAAAIRWHLPLVAHDAVYVGCPGLELLTELSH